MADSGRETAHLAETVAWLEDELRGLRALVAKLGQGLDQARAEIAELTLRVTAVEDRVTAMAPQLAGLPDMERQARGLRDEVVRLHHDTQTASARIGETARLVAMQSERERQALNELAHRLDALERATQGTTSRFDGLDEGVRRAMEAATLLRQRMEEIGRAAEAGETRLARLLEGSSRVEHEFTRLNVELDVLRRQDEQFAERLSSYTEMIKRLEAHIARVAADVTVKHDVIESIELSKVLIHRTEERIAGLEAAAEALRDRDEDAGRQLAQLDGRQKGLQERLRGVLEDFAAHREQVAEQFQRLHQLQERLKRRQLEELERDLRELRVYAFRAQEEAPPPASASGS